MRESDIYTPIVPTSDEVRAAIRRRTALSLPDDPHAAGLSAATVKRRFWEAICGDNASLLAEMTRIVTEANAALGAVVDKAFAYEEQMKSIMEADPERQEAAERAEAAAARVAESLLGDRLILRFSAHADGKGMVAEPRRDTGYVGFCVGLYGAGYPEDEPDDPAAYTWVSFKPGWYVGSGEMPAWADIQLDVLGDDYAVPNIYVGEGELPDHCCVKLDPTSGQLSVRTNTGELRDVVKTVGPKGDGEPLRGSASGADVVRMADVSPVEHELSVRVESRNLIDDRLLVNDCFVANEDGSYTMTSMGDGETERFSKRVCLDIPSDTDMTLSFFVVDADVSVIGIAYDYADGGSGYTGLSGIKVGERYSKTLKFIKRVSKIRLYHLPNSDTPVGSLITLKELQMALGYATDYVPYVDVSAIKVIRSGKNLFRNDVNKLTNCSDADGVARLGYEFHLPPGTYRASVVNEGIITYIFAYIIRANGTREEQENLIGHNAYHEPTYTIDKGDVLYLYYGASMNVAAERFSELKIQLERGDVATEFEPFMGFGEYTPATDGTVQGVTSLSPTTVLMSDVPNVNIYADYNRDLNRAYDELVRAILAMGGNV